MTISSDSMMASNKLTLSLAILLALTGNSGARWSVDTSARRLLSTAAIGPVKLAGAHDQGIVEAIESSYDSRMFRLSNKALGTRSSRTRADSQPAACDRSGRKCSVCALTRGSWCEEYSRQERVAWKPAPRGSKDCPATKWGPCNGVGNCHYDIGVCQCPAGWKGAACDEPNKRPCSERHKNQMEPFDLVLSNIGPDGMDLDLTTGGWSASRCAGFCDADRASCWCPANTTYGRKPPPPDSPPWVRYSQRGRPISEACKPGMVPDKSGKLVRNGWGNNGISMDDLVGPKGWCNVAAEDQLTMNTVGPCLGWRGCQDDALLGPMCDTVREEYCLNQCSGHGDCDAGYCRCHPGWYGHECARKKEGGEMEPGLEESRPWLKHVIVPVPAAAITPPIFPIPGAGTDAHIGRLRPLIYAYDMPPEFTSRMHQYKHITEHCGYRSFTRNNQSEVFADNYSLEVYLHEMLSISPHRTFDPEEADFFYVPVYYTCWTWPINGWADMPFWGAQTSWHRYSNIAQMWLAAKDWIQSNFPYWDRRGGRDHIWLTNHDEGACYMPTEIYRNSIMLTHWGRLEPNHTSNTAYTADNYSTGIAWPGVLGGADVKTLYEGHPCYDPNKDLVVPGFKKPRHYQRSPLLGAVPYERDILLYLRGDVGTHRLPNYSRGIRQKLRSLAETKLWDEKHRIFIGTEGDIPGDYGQHLARSIFCAVVPGDGFSMRMEDAVLHGCLPLIIMDNTHAVYESILDLDAFSLRINEAAVNEELPNLLKAISSQQIERMQRRLALTWHRFAYAHGPAVHAALRETVQQNLQTYGEKLEQVPPTHPYQPVHAFPIHTDALATIIQWLHSRIRDTR